MATRDRREFIPQALRCFSRQTYQESELIVVDDGRKSVGDLCRGIPRVRHIQLYKPANTGTKLNIGIERARGDILQKVDDDDYYHPDFLKLAAARLPSQPSVRTLVAWDCFLVLIAGEMKLRHSGHGWEAGGTFCFHRSLWELKPFRDVAKNEDYWFINDHRPRIRRVCAADYYMLVRHGRNTWQLMHGKPVDSYFRSLPPYRKELEAVVPPEDLTFYRSLQYRASFERQTRPCGN
jgi:glycosyltransferase involved in cell wall biosynthesis